jgi:hypothetical protein
MIRLCHLINLRVARIAVAGISLLLLGSSAAAQTNVKRDPDPLHLLNDSVRTLVKRVSPSVVHLIVNGYAPVDDNRDNANVTLGKQQSLGSGVATAFREDGDR